MKIVLLLLGLGTGAAAAASWLGSTPDSSAAPSIPIDPSSVQARVATLQQRIRSARDAGEQASKNTEQNLRQSLEAYRKSGSRAVGQPAAIRSTS